MTWAGLWKPQPLEVIPPEWVWGVVDALDWLYMYHNELRDCVEKELAKANYYLRLISAGKGIKTVIKTAKTTAEPLYVDELTCRRVIIKVPTDALYMIYIGDSQSQDFMLKAGEQIELFVKDPRQIYIKSTGTQNVFLLFELAHE